VDERVLAFQATKELDRKLRWVRPMMNRIAIRLLARATFGAKFRLFFGAAFSILGVITDVLTIIRFLNKDGIGLAKASIAFVGGCLLLQLFVAYLQNREMGGKKVLYEMVLVMTLIKPALDAHRVANGLTEHNKSMVTPSYELTITCLGYIKCVMCGVRYASPFIFRASLRYNRFFFSLHSLCSPFFLI